MSTPSLWVSIASLHFHVPYGLTIADKEIEIIQKLLEEVMVYESAMSDACDICAELDCLLSFAEASRAYNYQRPIITEDNILAIKGGRYGSVALWRVESNN